MNARSKSKTKISKNFTTVTVRLLKLIEAGVAPWRQPWHNINYQNLITQKDYTGINPVLYLREHKLHGTNLSSLDLALSSLAM